MNKLLGFARSVSKWVLSGKPYRSESEIEGIFMTKCSPCEHFEREFDGAGSCRLCGCNLKKSGQYFNKIAWASEKCPDNRW